MKENKEKKIRRKMGNGVHLMTSIHNMSTNTLHCTVCTLAISSQTNLLFNPYFLLLLPLLLFVPCFIH